MLIGVYDVLRKETPPHIAIYRARDIAATLLITAVESGPVGEFTFEDMAMAFLAADKIIYDGRYSDLLIGVFAERYLLTSDSAKQFLKKINSLPDLRLPEAINSALAAALFLENEVQPTLNIPEDAELVPLSAYRNADGYAYLNYFNTRQVKLEGEQFGHFSGSVVDMFGGLTLTFDANNMLCSMCYRPVTDEDMRQVKIYTSELIKEGLIVSSISPEDAEVPPESDAIGKTVPNVSQGFMGELSTVASHLVRVPTIVDHMPSKVNDLVDYLQRLRQKIKSK